MAIPLGSSSAAPVTNPGPKILSVLRNQPTGFGEVAVTVALANSPTVGAGPIGLPVTASDRSLPSDGNSLAPFALNEQIRPNYLNAQQAPKRKRGSRLTITISNVEKGYFAETGRVH